MVAHLARHKDAAARLQQETQLLRQCAHPHLVRLVGSADDGTWMATEWVDGPTLDSWAARSVAIADVVGVALDLVGTIRHLHQHHVIHGDLKPSNIIIDPWGHPKVLDLEGSAQQAGRGRVRGTPGFIAPETMVLRTLTPASDLYGLGACLFVALAGRPPYASQDPASLVHEPGTSAPVPPSAYRLDIPARLDRLVVKLLSRRPERRPTLDDVVKLLTAPDLGPCDRPQLGMVAPRRVLRAEVAKAADGAPRVAVIYGPPGSGRRTLAKDAAQQASAEGMRLIPRASPEAFRAAAARGLRPVTVWGTDPVSVHAAKELLQSEHAALVILVGTRPIPAVADLGGVHVMPEPLTRSEARQIGAWLGASAVATEEAHARASGLPQALWLGLQAHGCRPDVDARLFRLPSAARGVVALLRKHEGVLPLDSLASLAGLPIADLLEYCRILTAAGLVAHDGDGRFVRLTPEATS